jgi:hypothetical protein
MYKRKRLAPLIPWRRQEDDTRQQAAHEAAQLGPARLQRIIGVRHDAYLLNEFTIP